MTGDAGTKLLAAIEAMMSEIRGLRADLSRDRDASDALESRRRADAERQKKRRRSRDNNVTPSRDSHVTSQVVALDLSSSSQDLEKLQKREDPAASRDDNVTDAVRDLRKRTWHSYSGAYFKRYQTAPVRNAKVNGQLRELVKRLGEEAPEVAEFYVRHPGAFYVRSTHAFGPLLEHAEGLRTQWATGRQITTTGARQQERTAANADALAPLLREGKSDVV